MASVTVDFPAELFQRLGLSPVEVARDVRLAAVIEWFRQGLLSEERAAELAGLARVDFLAQIAARKIDVLHVDVAELARELEDD